MIYYIKINRDGIGEEPLSFHKRFEKAPTDSDIEEFLEEQEIGYDPEWCNYEYYQVK